MNALQRSKIALPSAAKGLLCVWLLLVVWFTLLIFINFARTGAHGPILNYFSTFLIYFVCTGIVTLAATTLGVIPYVCLRGTDSMLRKPWRMYVESCIVAFFASVILTHFVKPSAVTFWRSLWPYLTFALLTSTSSSVFYMRSLRQAASHSAALPPGVEG